MIEQSNPLAKTFCVVLFASLQPFQHSALIFRRAKAFIDDIVSRGHDMSNGQSGSMQEMIIPAGKAGLIIGKGGETIKQLQVRHSGPFSCDFNKLT